MIHWDCSHVPFWVSCSLFFPSSQKKGTFKKRQKKRDAGDSRYIHTQEMTTRLPTFGKLWYVAGRTTRNRWSTKAVANELFELAQRMVEVFLICQDFGIWTSPNYGIEDMNQAITEQKGASQMLPPADWWLQRTAVSITMRGLEFGNCSKTESLSMFCLLRKAERMLWLFVVSLLATLSTAGQRVLLLKGWEFKESSCFWGSPRIKESGPGRPKGN